MGLSTKQKVLVVAAVVFVVLVIILIVLGALGILTGGKDDTPDSDTLSCPDCLFQQSDWSEGEDGEYRATRKNCGSVLVTLTDNLLSIKKNADEGPEGQVKNSLSDFSKKIPGANQDSSLLTWKVDKTMRNNETVKLVFSDTGTQYAGCGNFDGPLFTAKPSGDSKVSCMLWKSEENPTYLPFYVSRNNEENAVCMFAEAQGAPIEITLTSTTTEWLIYSDEEVKVHSFNGGSVQDALDNCVKKWKEIYPSSGSSVDWTDNLIVGSLTPSQIKTDQENTDSPATHYILSPDSVTMTGSGLEISGGSDISDYSSVFLPMTASQKLDEDSGITATKENGYYPSNDEFILDFEKESVSTTVDTNFLQQGKAGILMSGLLQFPKGADCKKSVFCSDDLSEVDETSCLSVEFGDGQVFQKHNLYDVSMKKALKPGENLVIETALSPGTVHFHRTDLELTVAGLKTCYNNIFNLRRFGIGSVTCNMCAGVIPSTDSQKSICFRWSQLSLLMPYVIISSQEDLTGALSGSQNDTFAKLKENLSFKKQLRYLLASPDMSIVAKSNGILFGDNMFMVFNLEGSVGDIEVELPSGQWLAPDPEQQTEGTYLKSDSNSATITYEENISKLAFFKLGKIHVIKSSENEDHVEVHVMQLKDDNFGDNISGSFTVNGHTTSISFDHSDAKVTFSYQTASTTIDKNQFSLTKLVIYYWNKDEGTLDAAASNYAAGTDSEMKEKINVVFAYDAASASTIFEDREQKILQGGGDGR